MPGIKPIKDYVLAIEQEPKTKTDSGIYLSEQSKDSQRTAIVQRVGSEVEDIKSKDHIVYRGYNVVQVKIKEQKYVLIKEEDILAVIEGEK